MEIAKALILTAEEREDGSWPAASSTPKHLFPVANRPILFHNLEALRAAGVLEATILTERAGAGAIRDAVGDGQRWGISLSVDEWSPAVGVRGALASGRRFVNGEPVLVQRGDALLRDRMHGLISAFAAEELDAMALQLTQGGTHPGYLLSPRAVSILCDQPAAIGGTIAGVRAHGGRVRVEQVEGLLGCAGGQDALLAGNRAMMEDLRTATDGAEIEDSVVQGRVQIHPTATVRGTTIRGPAIIGAGAQVCDSYIGPYTAIGANAEIEGSEIEHSIVLPEAQIRFLGTRIESSVIGRGARVGRAFRLPAAVRLSIGDGAEVTLA
ncbi:MAG TPA: sugar phosphate nucleotidyltransferase [Baekduia sp.]|jgi:glucose-1-phosphate thymidylyltransferase